MEQDEHFQLLNQRLTALESKIEALCFNNEKKDPSTSSQSGDRLANLEALIARLEDNFLLIADIDTFAPLRDLLAEGNFKAADRETANILFDVISKTADTITPEDVETFPLSPLRIVDRLWRKYSQDRFGLSVQLKIYQELGGDLNTLIAQDEKLFFAFADRIGWRQNGKFILRENWEASLSSPEGFLPLTFWLTPYGLKFGNFILARLMEVGF